MIVKQDQNPVISHLCSIFTKSHFLLFSDETPLKRHPEFRLFACMNPATDIGKKELPANIRSRFTEIFCDELSDRQEVRQVVLSYLGRLNLEVTLIESIVELYFRLKELAENKLIDGVNRKPHYR